MEDNPTDVFLIRQALADCHMEVDLTIFRDGEAAINFVTKLESSDVEVCPSLILLDINLPRTDGFGVLGRLRESKRCAHTPVVIMTSSAAPSDRAKSSALGASAYFLKPSGYDEFLKIGEIIQHLLGK